MDHPIYCNIRLYASYCTIGLVIASIRGRNWQPNNKLIAKNVWLEMTIQFYFVFRSGEYSFVVLYKLQVH